jgi:precorrin-2 dehydrogenase / sirohydrochlorin ferrochelatase
MSTPPVYYPVFLDLRGRRCLVVGGGKVARRKVEGLLEAGARITVVAPCIEPMPEGVELVQREVKADDLDGMMYVIAATDNREVNAMVAHEAAVRGIWTNVVDDPELCTVILPAVVRRGAFCLAISTGGAGPVLARRLRERLEREFGEEYATLVNLLWRLRQDWEPRALATGLPGDQRREAWERVLELPLLHWLSDGEAQHAEDTAAALLEAVLHENEVDNA